MRDTNSAWGSASGDKEVEGGDLHYCAVSRGAGARHVAEVVVGGRTGKVQTDSGVVVVESASLGFFYDKNKENNKITFSKIHLRHFARWRLVIHSSNAKSSATVDNDDVQEGSHDWAVCEHDCALAGSDQCAQH